MVMYQRHTLTVLPLTRLSTLPSRVQPAPSRKLGNTDDQGKAATAWGQGRGGSKWRTRRERIFDRDGFVCQICKSAGIMRVVTLHGSSHGVCDHIVPMSQGGGDDDTNLQTICQACDAAKTQRESRGGA
jgi:5-methylcytosine-specific restriction enzyme A